MSKALLKDTIKYIIIYSLIAEIFAVFICLFTAFDGYDGYFENFITNIKIGSMMIFSIGTFLIIAIISNFVTSNISKWFFKIETDRYIRDIPEEIPPAIASLLYDSYIETHKDYAATIAGLFAKDYIEINNKNIIVKKSDTSNLMSHEVYVYEVLSKKREFIKKEYRNCIINDAIELKLFEKKDKKIIMKKVLFFTVINMFFIIPLIIYALYNGFKAFFELKMVMLLIWSSIMFCSIIIFVILVFKIISYISPGNDQSLTYQYSKTDLGYKYSIIVAAISCFFRDYTLIKERELESVKLLGEHVAYAIALDRTDKIEEFILNDDKFREIMYMNKYTTRFKYDFFVYEK